MAMDRIIMTLCMTCSYFLNQLRFPCVYIYIYQVCLIRVSKRRRESRRRDWTMEKARSGLSKSQELLQVSPEETDPPCSDRHDLVSPIKHCWTTTQTPACIGIHCLPVSCSS
jgi:hypothetical protein